MRRFASFPPGNDSETFPKHGAERNVSSCKKLIFLGQTFFYFTSVQTKILCDDLRNKLNASGDFVVRLVGRRRASSEKCRITPSMTSIGNVY